MAHPLQDTEERLQLASELPLLLLLHNEYLMLRLAQNKAILRPWLPLAFRLNVAKGFCRILHEPPERLLPDLGSVWTVPGLLAMFTIDQDFPVAHLLDLIQQLLNDVSKALQGRRWHA